jgi:hypothetical protein
VRAFSRPIVSATTGAAGAAAAAAAVVVSEASPVTVARLYELLRYCQLRPVPAPSSSSSALPAAAAVPVAVSLWVDVLTTFTRARPVPLWADALHFYWQMRAFCSTPPSAQVLRAQAPAPFAHSSESDAKSAGSAAGALHPTLSMLLAVAEPFAAADGSVAGLTGDAVAIAAVQRDAKELLRATGLSADTAFRADRPDRALTPREIALFDAFMQRLHPHAVRSAHSASTGASSAATAGGMGAAAAAIFVCVCHAHQLAACCAVLCCAVLCCAVLCCAPCAVRIHVGGPPSSASAPNAASPASAAVSSALLTARERAGLLDVGYTDSQGADRVAWHLSADPSATVCTAAHAHTPSRVLATLNGPPVGCVAVWLCLCCAAVQAEDVLRATVGPAHASDFALLSCRDGTLLWPTLPLRHHFSRRVDTPTAHQHSALPMGRLAPLWIIRKPLQPPADL